MSTYLKDQSAGKQFVAFLGLAAGLFLVNIVLSTYFFSDLTAVLTDKNASISPETISRFKWAQLISSTLIFIVPALLFGYYSSPNLFRYVGLKNKVSIVLTILAVILLFGVQPFVSWLGTINAKLNFGSLQAQLQQMEELYEKAMQTFLKMDSPLDLVINLFVMALLPAIGEELFFRGSLQKVLLRMSNKPWLAILLSSIVFALLHGTFFKIIPIFVLGLMLGTVYHVTRNLWYNILIHFCNNAFAVLSVYYGSKSAFLQKLNDETLVVPLYAAFFSLVVVVSVIYLMKRKSEEIIPEFEADEHALTQP